MNRLKYYAVYKPYNVLPQFTDTNNRAVLSDIFDFPKDVYPIGRLDMDSEGLLLLTNDKNVNDALLNPKFNHRREYLVQIEGQITEEAFEILENGVEINVNGKIYKTKKAKVEKYDASDIPERSIPIRFRKNIPTDWIKLSLTEGKNRQVRKMTAKVGYPTLRLIRYSIESLCLDSFEPGRVREFVKDEFYRLLNLKK